MPFEISLLFKQTAQNVKNNCHEPGNFCTYLLLFSSVCLFFVGMEISRIFCDEKEENRGIARENIKPRSGTWIDFLLSSLVGAEK